MKKTWLIIANAQRVYIYNLDTQNLQYLLIAIFEHPETTLKVREINSDDYGQFGPGTGGHGIYRHSDPHEATVEQFAHSISKFIEDGRGKNFVNQLIVIAEARFQGILYETLPTLSQKMVTKRISKDYVPIIDRELDGIMKIIQEEVKESNL